MKLLDLVWVANDATEIEVRDLAGECVYRGLAGCITVREAKEWRVAELVPRHTEQDGTILYVTVEEVYT